MRNKSRSAHRDDWQDNIAAYSGLQSTPAPQRAILRSNSITNFGAYHDLIGASGSTTSRYGDVFAAAVTAYNVPGLALFDRQLVGVEHCRDAAWIRRDGFEHFYLQVLRSGRITSGPFGREQRLAPGDAILFDATQPQRSRVEDADYVTIVLSRDLVEAAAPDARALHGRVLPRSGPGSLGDVVLSLGRRATDPLSGPVQGSARLIADLLGEHAGGEPGRRSSDDADANDARRLQAELFIDSHLGEDLNVALIARALNVSRSSLYRAFSPIGGVEETITRRRAARLREMILRASETRSIDALAQELGFAASSHASRVFKQLYGLSPNRLRAVFQNSGHPVPSDLQVDRMTRWYAGLNASAV